MMPFVDLAGYWLGIFLTFAVLSFLYKDNPFYKFAEHLFVGVSIGYVITQQFENVIVPNLIGRLVSERSWIDLIPLALVAMLFVRAVSRRFAWVGRYPLAFVVALYAGLQVNAVAQSDLAEQIAVSTRSPVVIKVDVNRATVQGLAGLPGFTPAVAQKVVSARAAGSHFAQISDLAALPTLSALERRDLEDASTLSLHASTEPAETDAFDTASRILLLVGLCASLIYFYFSAPQTGTLGKVARFGVYVLMIGFGASFGSTVQGRLALAVGRAMDVLDKDKPPELAGQIHGPLVSVVSIVLIVLGIVLWEKVWLRRQQPKTY